MKKLVLTLAIAGLAVAAQPMFADAVGTVVDGALYLGNNTAVNLFDPTNGLVPVLDSNHAGVGLTIGNGTTFGYSDGIDSVLATFTGTTLSISELNLLNIGPVELQFTDAEFLSVDNLTGAGIENGSGLVGDTLKVFLDGGIGLHLYTADITCSDPGSGGSNPGGGTSVTPEPSSVLLLGTGLLGTAGVMRRRYLQVTA